MQGSLEGAARVVYLVGGPPAPKRMAVNIAGTSRIFGLVAAADSNTHVARLEALTATRSLVAHGREFLDEPETSQR